jgi:hypothetical protein
MVRNVRCWPRSGTPVDDQDYQVPFRFTGKIAKLTIKLGPEQIEPADKAVINNTFREKQQHRSSLRALRALHSSWFALGRQPRPHFDYSDIGGEAASAGR